MQKVKKEGRQRGWGDQLECWKRNTQYMQKNERKTDVTNGEE